MPFGLKNTEAIYKKFVNLLFKYMIGVTIEVYIGDMLVKSSPQATH